MTSPTPPAVLALDVDGVVIHTSPGAPSEWYGDLMDDLGIDPAQLHARFFEPHWAAIIVGRADLKVMLKPVLRTLKSGLSVDAFLAYWFKKHSYIDNAVINEVRSWSRQASGRAVLITNQEKYRAEYLWNVVGLRHHFDRMIWSGQLGVTKSHTDFFHQAGRLLAVPRASVLYFDDDDSNVRTATESGWDSHCYRGIDGLRVTLSCHLQRPNDAGRLRREPHIRDAQHRLGTHVR